MENIQPRRHGFRASALAPAEGKGVTTTTAAYERAVAAYEREIEAIDDADDPLDVYCRMLRCWQS